MSKVVLKYFTVISSHPNVIISSYHLHFLDYATLNVFLTPRPVQNVTFCLKSNLPNYIKTTQNYLPSFLGVKYTLNSYNEKEFQL